MDPRAHWDGIYQSRSVGELSWFQPEARRSLELITRFAPDRSAPIIDVGGGASVLVDDLLDAGYTDLTVLDISAAALATVKERLGAMAPRVRWLEGDILSAPLDEAGYAFWHDRAVFHFLTRAKDRKAYVDRVRQSVRRGGHVLVATFGSDGPTKCSGLPVVRYSVDSLQSEFGPGFHMLASEHEDHRTPDGRSQSFLYCLCRRE
ncbi:MAG: class I SAM-dependent methyltransferase [Gemmatimonadaceae bacterium]